MFCLAPKPGTGNQSLDPDTSSPSCSSSSHVLLLPWSNTTDLCSQCYKEPSALRQCPQDLVLLRDCLNPGAPSTPSSATPDLLMDLSSFQVTAHSYPFLSITSPCERGYNLFLSHLLENKSTKGCLNHSLICEKFWETQDSSFPRAWKSCRRKPRDQHMQLLLRKTRSRHIRKGTTFPARKEPENTRRKTK